MATTLVLGWEKDRVAVLEGSLSGGALSLSRANVIDWPENISPVTDPAAAGDYLKRELQKLGSSASSAFVCVPRHDAVLRQIELPNIPDEELPEIVKLQAATKSSIPLDQMMVDFLPLPYAGGDTRSVLVATVQNQYLTKIQKNIDAAGLELLGAGLSSVGLGVLAMQYHPPGEGDTLVAVHASRSRLEIVLVRNRNILLMHSAFLADSVSRDKAILTEINRVMIAAEQKLGATRGGPVVFFADTSFDLPLLRDEFGAQLSVVDLFDSPLVLSSRQSPDRSEADLFVGPAGLLLQQQSSSLSGIDFIHPRKKAVIKDTRRQKLALYGTAAATAIGFVLYLFNGHLNDLDRTISELQEKQVALNQDLTAGKPTLAANASVQDWQSRDLHLLQEIDQFQKTLPGTEFAYLQKFQFDVSIGKNLAKYNASGLSKERDVVEEMYRAFDKEGFQVTPQEIPASRRDSEYPSKFDLVLELPPPQKKTPQANAGGAK